MPPLIVESLQTMTHSRPATLPIPVIRPAPWMASSYISFAASGDNSKNGAPESSSVTTRWRGRSLPRARWRSRARGGPPSAAVARRLSSSAISCRMAASLARNSLDLQSTFEAIVDTEPRLSPEQIFRNEPLSTPSITRARLEKLCRPVCVAKSIGRERPSARVACANTQSKERA